MIWTPTTTYVHLFHLLVVIPQLTNCYSLEASARCLLLPARSNVLLPAVCGHSIFQTVVVDTLIYLHYSELCLWFAFKYSSHTHTYFSLTNKIFRSCTGTCIWIVSYNIKGTPFGRVVTNSRGPISIHRVPFICGPHFRWSC